jgi:hypothetical protein
MEHDIFNTEMEEESLETRFAKERLGWSNKISELSKRINKIFDIPSLMTDIYTERQRCVEYHHYLITLLIQINKEYKKQYCERHDYWTHKSQLRYPNESSKNMKILHELADIVTKRETLDNHAKFVDRTIQTIDNIIYAIPKRIEVEQISRGK